VNRGEKVSVEVPVTPVGEVVPGALLQQESATVTVEAEATHLPTAIELDVAGLPVGTQVTAAQLRLPQGVSLATDPEHAIVLIAEAPSAEQLEGDTAQSAGELGVIQEPSGGAAGGGTAPAGAAGNTGTGDVVPGD
jgi:large subunit ribosomal protein L25